MSDQPDNLVLELLRAIRAEQGETNHKIGALAESMVSMRKGMGDVEERLEKVEVKLEKVDNRLDKIEAHYNPV